MVERLSQAPIDPVGLTLLRSALLLLFVFVSAWTGYVLARRALVQATGSARIMAAVLLALVLQHGLLCLLDAFWLLRLPLFRPAVALPVALVLCALVHRFIDGTGARAALREDLGRAADAARELSRSWVHWLVMAWLLVAAGSRALVGLVSPPMTWDTLTYHALKAAEWVQYGHKIRTLAPDQWSHYTYVPDAPEVPGAWSMLFLNGDLGLPFVGIALWGACAFAVYALARALDSPRPTAFRAGLLTAVLPALLTEMVSGYADMFVLLAFLALAFALVRCYQRRGVGEAILLGASAGLLAQAKLSGLPMAFAALVFLAFAPSTAERETTRRWSLLLAALATLCVAGPHYLAIWVDRGTPFYPFTVKLFGVVLSEGNAQLRAKYAGAFGVIDPRWASGIALLQSLVVPLSPPKVEYGGFGPGFLLLAPLGFVGLVLGCWGRGRPHRVRLLRVALLTISLIPLLGLMSKELAGLRAIWLPNLGRLLLPLPAVLAALAAGLKHWVSRAIFVVALALTLPWGWPRGVADPMLVAVAAVAPWLALSLFAGLGLAVAFARHPLVRDRTEYAVPAVLALMILVLVAPLQKIRHDSCYEIRAAATDDHPAFIMQFTLAAHAAAWPLWRALDDGPPHRVHASYGWDGIGHNDMRYPLLGSHLQNRVFYVPITRGQGQILDYQNLALWRKEADEAAWIARLDQAGVDRVFFGEPAPLEAQFVERHPERFQLLGRGEQGLHALYRFIPRSGPGSL